MSMTTKVGSQTYTVQTTLARVIRAPAQIVQLRPPSEMKASSMREILIRLTDLGMLLCLKSKHDLDLRLMRKAVVGPSRRKLRARTYLTCRERSGVTEQERLLIALMKMCKRWLKLTRLQLRQLQYRLHEGRVTASLQHQLLPMPPLVVMLPYRSA